jgi:type IV secretion system protein VirB3
VTELRRTPLHRALHRPALMLGGERSLVLSAASVFGGIAISAMNAPAIVSGVVLWIASLFLFRLMAKSDPRMSAIYMRAIKYAGYYPAVPLHWRKD